MTQSQLSERQAHGVMALLSRSNFPDLTAETLMAAFEAEGIRSLEDLATSVTEALREPHRGGPGPVPIQELGQPTAPALRGTTKRPTPKLPVRVDGTLYDPQDVGRFDDDELAFFVRSRDEIFALRDRAVWGPIIQSMFLTNMATGLVSRPVLAASAGSLSVTDYGPHYCPYPGYTDPWTPFSSCPYPPPPPEHPAPIPNPPPYVVRLATEKLWHGDHLDVGSGESYMDLTHVGWWIYAEDWNDKFMSIHQMTCLAGVFEHVHFGGDYLQIGPNTGGWSDLDLVGWGHRISAVINSG